MNKLKRLISFLLAFIIVFSVFSVCGNFLAVFADDLPSEKSKSYDFSAETGYNEFKTDNIYIDNHSNFLKWTNDAEFLKSIGADAWNLNGVVETTCRTNMFMGGKYAAGLFLHKKDKSNLEYFYQYSKNSVITPESMSLYYFGNNSNAYVGNSPNVKSFMNPLIYGLSLSEKEYSEGEYNGTEYTTTLYGLSVFLIENDSTVKLAYKPIDRKVTEIVFDDESIAAGAKNTVSINTTQDTNNVTCVDISTVLVDGQTDPTEQGITTLEDMSRIMKVDVSYSDDNIHKVVFNIEAKYKKGSQYNSFKMQLPYSNSKTEKAAMGIMAVTEWGMVCGGAFSNPYVKYDFSSYGEYINELIENLPETSEVKIGDKEKIISVYNKFKRLSDNQKSKVSDTSIAKLNSVYSALQALLKAENDEYGDYILENDLTFENSSDIGALEGNGFSIGINPKKNSINTSTKCLALEKSDERNVVKFLDNAISGKKNLSTFSGKLYIRNYGNATIVYEYIDADNYSAVDIYRQGNSLRSTPYGCTDGVLRQNGEQSYFKLGTEKDCKLNDGWANFLITYDELSTCRLDLYIVDNSGNNLLAQRRRRLELSKTNFTKVGFLSCNSETYFDDIRVTFQDANHSISKQFNKKYSELLNLFPALNYVASFDEVKISEMSSEYSALPKLVKRDLPFAEFYINSLESAINDLKNRTEYTTVKSLDNQLISRVNSTPENYTDFTISTDFSNESELRYFTPVAGNVPNNSVSVVYSEKFKSNVLKLYDNNTLTIKRSIIPGKTPKIKKFSYKIYREQIYQQNAGWNSLRVPISYIDSNNFNMTGWYNVTKATGDELHRHNSICLNGKLGDGYNNTVISDAFVWGDVWTVEATYSERGEVILVVSDEHGNVMTTSSTAELNAIFALNSSGSIIYIDDLSVTYECGSYAVDEDITNIHTYFAGNTFVSPGDLAYINGENISENVEYVYIEKLNDNTVSNGKTVFNYVNKERYDYDGVHNNEFTKEPVANTWSDTDAVAVDIVQRNENSIKFVIPNDFEKGVYAVKLVSSNGNSKILYLNAPEVDYSIGTDGGEFTAVDSEGRTTTTVADPTAKLTNESCARSAPGEEVRIIGQNLGVNKANVKVRLVNTKNTSEVISVDDSVKVQSDYSLTFKIPTSLSVPTDGKYYEVYIYNGYGDTTCWSIPCLIKVQGDLRNTWSQKVFNLRDFGANGSSNQNATPFFISVLTAIKENGGGILYLPSGQYQIQQELIIPENCQVIGEDVKNTTIFIRPYNWDYNEFECDAMFKFTNNVSFANICIMGSRLAGVFKGYGSKSENLYFNNIKYYIQPAAGPVSEAPSIFTILKKASDLKAMLDAEAVNPLMTFATCAINLRLENINLTNAKGKQTPMYNYKKGSAYWYVDNYYGFDNSSDNGGWQISVADYTVIDNSNQPISIWGHGNYLGKTVLGNSTTNNREAWVADLAPLWTGTMKPKSGTDDWFEYYGTLNGLGTTGQIYVRSGQGEGQTRRIVETKNEVVSKGVTRTWIRIDRPFSVQINSSSKLIIRRPRQDMYFVDNYVYNGGAGFAFYGGCADIVCDGNRYEGVHCLYEHAIFGDVNWYMSFVNESISSDNSMSNITGGTVNDDGVESGWQRYAKTGKNAQVGLIHRNNTIIGQYMSFSSNTENGAVDFIFDNNEFYDLPYIFTFYETALGSKFHNYSGWYVTRNCFNTQNLGMTDEDKNTLKVLSNSYNNSSSPELIMAFNESSDGVLKGDVSGNGRVDVMDCTLIRDYVLEKTELTEAQKLRADVDGDGEVTLMDATLIKMFILEKITSFSGVTVTP